LDDSGENHLIKKITIIYTDKFSKRNIETSPLIDELKENGFQVSVVSDFKKSFFKKVVWKISFIFNEILKYRFLEVYNIKKQKDKHRYQNTEISNFDKLKKHFGFPFPKSKLMLNFISKINECIPSLIDDIDTDLIFLTSMQSYIADNFIKYAKKRNLPVVCLLSSWDHLTHGRKVIVSDQIIYYMVWNTIQENELIKLHNINKEKIRKVGALQFDFLKKMLEDKTLNRNELSKELSIPGDYKIISLMAYNERLAKNEPYVISKILEKTNSIQDKFIIIIRPFPFDNSFNERYKNILKHDNIRIVPVSNDVKKDRRIMSLILKNSDIVLSGPGTAAIEAMYYDTPVIHIGIDQDEKEEINTLYKEFFFSDHYQHIMNKQASYFCLTTKHLIESINSYFNDNKIHASERKKLIQEQLYNINVSSSKAISEVLDKLYKKKSF